MSNKPSDRLQFRFSTFPPQNFNMDEWFSVGRNVSGQMNPLNCQLCLRMPRNFLMYFVKSGGLCVNFVRGRFWGTFGEAVVFVNPILGLSVYSLIILSSGYIPKLRLLWYPWWWLQ